MLSMSPQAPHLVPRHERLMMRPSTGRGDPDLSEVLAPGIRPDRGEAPLPKLQAVPSGVLLDKGRVQRWKATILPKKCHHNT
jgi:hypothetical protein